ncbi:MAG: hypothetical protein AB8W37_02390 [Arsenophonus endosymbiont of Dermacentor nuttalli]
MWIIDIAKNEADRLGIDWQSSYHTKNGNFLLNTSDISAAAGLHFLAKIRANESGRECTNGFPHDYPNPRKYTGHL